MDITTKPRASAMRRMPKQERSRERVDEILAVAMRLIGEKGIDAVTMKEVAQHSGGPIASVYQYFPNKSAIIGMLYERYSASILAILSDCMRDVDSLDSLLLAVSTSIRNYHDFMKGEPALVDLVNAVHADKSLQHVDTEQTHVVVDAFYGTTCHLFPEAALEQYRRTLFLLVQLTSSTVRLALAMPEEAGRAMVEEFSAIVRLQLSHLAKS